MLPVGIAKFLRIVFFYNTSGGCFWQSYDGTVKPARVPAFDFAPPRAFDINQKLSRTVAQIILYYHLTNRSLLCLIWWVMYFWFQNMFWKNINCFRFWWKTYTKCCASNYVIHVSNDFLLLHFAVGQVLSIWSRMIWKTEHSGENPDFDFVPLLFTLLT